MPRKQMPRGKYLIDIHGQPLHQYDMVFHKNGIKDFVTSLYADNEDLYVYTSKGFTWNVKNISLDS